MSCLKKSLVVLGAIAACSTASVSLASKDAVVEYPEGFRTFDHVNSAIVEPGFIFNGVDLGAQVPGLHHIYANKKAMRGYRELNVAEPGTVVFKDGSVIVFDLLQTETVTSGTGTATFAGDRLAVIVMEKDSKRYAATGGWGFEVFDPVTKNPALTPADQADCFACHQLVSDSDFVFSRLHD